MSEYIKTILLIIVLSLISFNCQREISSSNYYDKAISISLIKPDGGERYTVDDLVDVRWSWDNLDDSLRIELFNADLPVYSINGIPNSGYYTFRIPADIIPSKEYKLKIESMTHPEIFDISNTAFEIAPLIDGHWYYSDLTEFSGIEIELFLISFINESFIGSGSFHLKYRSMGNLKNYERSDTVGGTMSYPNISFIMREPGGKEFNFVGQMITNATIRGRIRGFVDSTYGSLDDSLTLTRQ